MTPISARSIFATFICSLKGVHVGNQHGRVWKPRRKTPLGFQDVRQGWLGWVSQTRVKKSLILRNGGRGRDGGNCLQPVRDGGHLKGDLSHFRETQAINISIYLKFQDTAEKNARKVFSQLDIDRDGELNEDEFVKGCLKVFLNRSDHKFSVKSQKFRRLIFTYLLSGLKPAGLAQWFSGMNSKINVDVIAEESYHSDK